MSLSISALTHWPPGRPIILHNTTCIYCGEILDRSSRTKEHVVGRRFVPRGKLHGQWNLIAWSCLACNGSKADLEDDISAITIHAGASAASVKDDLLIAEAARKAAHSVSRRTKRFVAASQEHLTVKFPMGPGAVLTFNLTGPPQMEQQRAFDLARLHVTAFFYFITYNKLTKRGRFWRDGCYLVTDAARPDWGNVTLRAYMEAVVNWEPRVIAVGADGFFKLVIRRHPAAECWSWAVEWNHGYRVVGFCGDRAPAETIVRQFPRMPMKTVFHRPNEYLRVRTEVALVEQDDTLFHWDEPPSAGSTP
jgi:hypothetical protein